MNWRLFLVAVSLALLCTTGNAQAPLTKPSAQLRGNDGKFNLSSAFFGLPSSAASRVSATLGRDVFSYQVQTRNAGFHAENARQKLAADFIPEGVRVSHGAQHWTMSLRGYGYGDSIQEVDRVAPQAQLNRVEYRRGPLTEWYVNGPVGLEQGFTLNQPPSSVKGQPLTIALDLSGDLTPSVDQKGTELSLSRGADKPELHYAGLTAHDATGRELQAWLELKGSELRLRVRDAGARYPVVVDPWVQLAELAASDGVAGDQLGISVAISGSTIVAGAENATVGSNAAQGAAYVFVKGSGGWANMTETAKLTASDGQASDGFGGAVGIAGNTIVVGACSQSGICNGTGKVYVFEKPKGGWKTTSKFKAELTPSDGVSTDGFSNEMSISGDGNTVVAGSFGATVNGQTNAGAAYIFVKPSSGWKTMTETAKLTEPKPKTNDDFCEVSVSSDGSTVFVGALQYDIVKSAGTGPGKAYIFVRPASGWKSSSAPQAKLTAKDGVSGDLFGFCQVGSSCISSDGTTVLAGAPYANSFAGKGYVFVEPAAGWATTSKFNAELTLSDGQADFLGWSAAITDNTAVVGAVVGNGGTGAAYVFTKPKNGWKTTSKFKAELTASDGTSGDAFAFSLGISGNTIVVGSINATGGAGPGAAYVFGK